MRLYLLQYKRGSRSAKELATALEILRLNQDTTRYTKRLKDKDIVINWGCSQFDFNHPDVEKVFNLPDRVARASNKLLFFQEMGNCPSVTTVPWTQDENEAKRWERGVARTKLNSSGGNGIVLFSGESDFVEAPLYTQYVPKTREFRVHVAFGKVIDSQRKIRDPSKEITDWSIRNHENGFIFARESGKPTDASLSMAIDCVNHLGLDFGAVDIIENKSGSYILEVNTAPGLEGQTIESYKRAFEQEVGDSYRRFHRVS